MWFDHADVVGTVGVILILFCYHLLQSRKLTIDKPMYSWMNLVGSVLITYSLLFHWNTPSFVIEVAWITISLQGLKRVYKKQK